MIDYLDVLSELHHSLLPDVYLEIGVHQGDSLRLADPRTTVIGVDPEPDMAVSDPLVDRVVISTSDEFFAGGLPAELCGGRAVDLAFVDGMHLFDFALRDFAHAERLSDPGGLIAVHDVLPRDAVTASRERSTEFWTGDVWKLVLCLLDRRPDLDLRIIDVQPSGLCLVCGLSPDDGSLLTTLDDATAAYIDLDYAEWERRLPEVLARTTDNAQSRAWAHRRETTALADEREAGLLRDLEATGAHAQALTAELAGVRAELQAGQAQLVDLEGRLQLANARIADLEGQIRTVAESLSWKLTAPGRSLRGVLKGSPRG